MIGYHLSYFDHPTGKKGGLRGKPFPTKSCSLSQLTKERRKPLIYAFPSLRPCIPFVLTELANQKSFLLGLGPAFPSFVVDPPPLSYFEYLLATNSKSKAVVRYWGVRLPLRALNWLDWGIILRLFNTPINQSRPTHPRRGGRSLCHLQRRKDKQWAEWFIYLFLPLLVLYRRLAADQVYYSVPGIGNNHQEITTRRMNKFP